MNTTIGNPGQGYRRRSDAVDETGSVASVGQDHLNLYAKGKRA